MINLLLLLQKALEDLQNVLDFRSPRGLLYQLHHVFKLLLRALVQEELSEHADTARHLSLVVVFVVQSAQHVKALQGELELSLFVVLIGYQIQEVEGVVGGVHFQVQIPGLFGLAVFYQAFCIPGIETELRSVLVTGYLGKHFLCLLVLLKPGQGNSVVPVKVIVIYHVLLNGL